MESILTLKWAKIIRRKLNIHLVFKTGKKNEERATYEVNKRKTPSLTLVTYMQSLLLATAVSTSMKRFEDKI